jgi:nucleotide-binding universal stress UspA family protein
MKTIIVPVDFNPETDTAIAYAASLAKITGSTVLLLYSCQLPVTMNDFPVLMVSVEDLKASADTGLSKIKAEAQKKFGAVNFETESWLGDAGEAIETVAKKRDALCIITGIQKLSGIENFLLGNDTLSLMKDCSRPVIAVPEGSIATAPRNIVLAVDDTGADKIPLQEISSFVTALQAQLHVVHVETEGEKVPASQQNLMELLAPLSISYHAIKSSDVTEGITGYLSQSGADLLMLLPHKHNLYERLFFKGHTAEIVGKVSLPVVCIRG